MTYKSTFQDRAGQAAEAKQKALERYRARPALDEKTAADRLAAAEQRDALRAEKTAAKKAEREAADQTAAKASAAKAAAPTDEERKAARDAKYAARKARK